LPRRENIKNPPPRPFPWFWVTIAVSLLFAGGWGAQAGIRWHKNRYRVGPSEVIKLLEAGKHPVILDARQQAKYDLNPIKIYGSIRLSRTPRGGGRPRQTRRSRLQHRRQPNMARDLRKLGFKDVKILKGGLGAWTNAGLPIETRTDISAVGVELYKALIGGS
jgi:rhodanese-related sulfurtransferase